MTGDPLYIRVGRAVFLLAAAALAIGTAASAAVSVLRAARGG